MRHQRPTVVSPKAARTWIPHPAHCFRIQPAGQDQRSGKVRGPSPIIRCAINQDCLGGWVIGNKCLRVFNPERFPNANTVRMTVRRFATVKLRNVEPDSRADPFDHLGGLVDKHTHLPDFCRNLMNPGFQSARL